MYLEKTGSEQLISRLIWVYFYLLIFEGALRKWFLPGLASPLLIVRDPVALLILFYSQYYQIWKVNTYVMLGWILSFISFVLSLAILQVKIPVAVYGLRIMLLHFPLIFIIGKVWSKQDVLKLGHILLWICIGMTLLVAMQFYSPQSAWVNRGVGGDLEGSGFSGAAGFYRVPGTFSFTTGLSAFYGLVFPFIIYFWMGKTTNRFLLVLATIAYAVAVPLTISRTVFFQTVLSIVFLALVSTQNKKLIFSLVLFVLVVVVLSILVVTTSLFSESILAFTTRFEAANRVEGGLVEGVLMDRFLGGMLKALNDSGNGWFGQGLGLGSNVGARLMSSDKFLISEGEWGRIIGERGMLLGLFVILIRLVLVITLSVRAWVNARRKNILPWLLLSLGAVLLLQGQWSQPTALGFSMLLGGLILASCKENF